jgi:hypothetical protein
MKLSVTATHTGGDSAYPARYRLDVPNETALAEALARAIPFTRDRPHDHVVMTAYGTACREMGLPYAGVLIGPPGDQDPGLSNANLRIPERRIAFRDSPLLNTRDLVEIGVRTALIDASVAAQRSAGKEWGVIDDAEAVAKEHIGRCMQAFDARIPQHREPGRSEVQPPSL